MFPAILLEKQCTAATTAALLYLQREWPLPQPPSCPFCKPSFTPPCVAQAPSPHKHFEPHLLLLTSLSKNFQTFANIQMYRCIILTFFHSTQEAFGRGRTACEPGRVTGSCRCCCCSSACTLRSLLTGCLHPRTKRRRRLLQMLTTKDHCALNKVVW